MKIQNYMEYVIAIIWFVVITLKIVLFGRSFDQIEVAFVNYGLGLLLFIVFHYFVYKRKRLPKVFLKSFLKMVINSLTVGLASIIIVHL